MKLLVFMVARARARKKRPRGFGGKKCQPRLDTMWCLVRNYLYRASMYRSRATGNFTMAERGENILRLLSWNIDGLDEKNTKERTEEVCRNILLKRPHLVFLQEIVSNTQTILFQRLGHVYSLFVNPAPPARYYPVILINHKCGEIAASMSRRPKDNVLEFPGSSMGRHLLQLNINFHGVSLQAITTHLESLYDYSAERKSQLKICFDEVVKHTRQGKICIFGGDLNVRDHELKDLIPECTVDVWQACGSAKEEEFTWDMTVNNNLSMMGKNKPKLRFDRLYLTQAYGTDYTAHPVKFELIGKDHVADCERYPSDHWGMWAEFSVCTPMQKVE